MRLQHVTRFWGIAVSAVFAAVALPARAAPAPGCSECEARCRDASGFLRRGCGEVCKMACRARSASLTWDAGRLHEANLGGRVVSFTTAPAAGAEAPGMPVIARWKTYDKRADLRPKLEELGIGVKRQE